MLERNLLSLIKQAATEANEAGKPVKIVFGEVTAIKPLQIMVEQKLPLSEGFLVLTEAVKDHEHEITVIDWQTENASGGSGDAAYAAHNHPITGRKRIILHNALKVGEHVLLLAMQGGQKYVVVDRL